MTPSRTGNSMNSDNDLDTDIVSDSDSDSDIDTYLDSDSKISEGRLSRQ